MTQVTLAEKLRYLRKSRRLSQVEVARRLGLTNNAYISNLERGTKRPSEALLRKLAELFVYDYESLRALAQPQSAVSEQVELKPASGADLVARIRREIDLFGGQLSDLVSEALPEFLWSREQRLIVEGGSREVWIVAPAITYHGVAADLLAVAVANLRRGVRYRYLTSDTKAMRVEAGRLLKRYQAAPRASVAAATGSDSSLPGEAREGAGPEIGFVPRDSLPFVFETALFDPQDSSRIRGSLVPPSEEPEWEIALSNGQAVDLARHFALLWDRVNVPLPRAHAG
jgi:transcriptional regulator with XRE-family HTH domain